MDIQLGFSTGALYKFCTTKKALGIFRSLGFSIVELGVVGLESVAKGWLDEITPEDLKGFDYVSLHAPKFDYGDNKGTKAIFAKIERVNKMRELETVIFHPDLITDLSVFHRAPFKVAFENMDRRKSSFQTPEELSRVVMKSENFKAVLDVNHIYTNDPTMQSVPGFYKELGDRIVQIHLSGYTELHDPLYVTKQTQIVAAVKDLTHPIIIESVISPDEVEKERSYILQTFRSL